MTNPAIVENCMDDPDTRRFIRGLECQFKRKFGVDKVRWWLEGQTRCMTYRYHLLSLNHLKKLVKKVSIPTLEFPTLMIFSGWMMRSWELNPSTTARTCGNSFTNMGSS